MLVRKIVMVLLACGVVGGYSSGFRHMRHMRQRHHDAQMQQMSQQCAEAAVRATARVNHGLNVAPAVAAVNAP